MGKRKMDSDLHRIKLDKGTVYQTSKGGNYYFRYQVRGERKCVSLKTANREEAIRKAKRPEKIHAALTANCDMRKIVEFISEQAST